MMSGATLRLVLLVSMAHAMVHVYELSLPGVEQEIAKQYHGNDTKTKRDAGKKMTGALSTCWRLPWGLCALLAGWLVDRYGGRRMLVIYMLGCSATCALVAACNQVPLLFVGMIAMGALASIYHPAGLTLISHETDPVNRPRALGLHGIFGSAGIALAPFLAFGVLSAGFNWQEYYWFLVLPGIALGIVFAWQTYKHKPDTAALEKTKPHHEQEDRAHWRSFFTLTMLAVLQGVIYSAVITFLPRFLKDFSNEQLSLSRAESEYYHIDKLLAAGVLLMGCIGQFVSGFTARPKTLERQLTLIMFANAPFLFWMAFADGWYRPLAAALFALVHFMHQPIYNSLIAKYTPRRRRSLCFGFSFAMGLGLGGIGALLAGQTQDDRLIYSSLAVVAVLAGCLGARLWFAHRHPDND